MDIFSNEEQERIVHAITVAESMTSGEIRLVVDRKLSADSALDGAVAYFRKLNMHKTSLKNGVLIYLATEDHAFAIIGDEGINLRVGDDFWDDTKEQMVNFFRTGDVVQGLITGIRHAGEQLQYYFPRRGDDVNELPDEIHFGSN